MHSTRLADRLGLTCHESPLRFKIRRLMRPLPETLIEPWLVQVANHRGACIITQPFPGDHPLDLPSRAELSDEELVCAIIQPNGIDHPQIIRLAAQLISRDSVNVDKLLFLCEMERSLLILTEIARQAIKVDPDHQSWSAIAAATKDFPPLREPIIHWTRLSEPIMEPGQPNARGWKLVA